MEILSSIAAVMLIAAGAYFAIKFKCFYILHPIKTIRNMPKNGVKQMLLSLGGTVGVGNISGVAVAIMLGGSGAVFWMWVGAFFAMALKYAEITLGMLEKKGACHYIKNTLGALAATLFLCLLITDVVLMGGMIQSSAISEAAYSAFGMSRLVSGIIVCLLAAAVFFFKIDILKLSAYIVPLMSIGYVVLSFAVIINFRADISNAFSQIFKNAFDTKSAAGGLFGFIFTPAFRQGIVKGLFSNEAGCGTAPSAHASSNEKVPAKQGLFGIVEVFVDTVLMCTLTALVILLTLGDSISQIGGGGTSVCAAAFAKMLGGAAYPILVVFVFLFAFSAIVSFGYYGMNAFASAKLRDSFLICYCLSLFIGATAAPEIVWKIADLVICAMLIINTSAVLANHKTIAKEHHSLYGQMGNLSQSASITRDFSSQSIKKEIPISESEIKRGSIS